MADPLATSAAVATILVGAKEVAKSIAAIAKKTKNEELEDRTVELLEIVRRAQALAVERATRADELEEENRTLRKQLGRRSEMQQERDMLYRYLEDGTKDGPFCLHCSLKHDRELRLMQGDAYVEFKCPSCRTGAGTMKPRPRGPLIV